ncbi:hypothetical protein [Cupriavidus alkaliphilus]
MKRNERIKTWLLALTWVGFVLVATSWVDDDQVAPAPAPVARFIHRT